MNEFSRRRVLQATAGAAIAVPMAALGGQAAAAGVGTAGVGTAGVGTAGVGTAGVGTAESAGAVRGRQWSVEPADPGPVMFCIHDAQRAEVSILHGTSEVIVRDRQLVARILQAAGSQPATTSQKA